MSIKPPIQGFKRQWTKCRTCGNVAYYDYQPYSLSNPFRELPCGHGIGQRFVDTVTNIDETEALAFIENTVWDDCARLYQ